MDSWRYEGNRQAAPRGGHERLVRRLARQLAIEAFPHARVTAEELDSLELAIQAGAVTSDDIELIIRGRDPTAYPPLQPVPPEVRTLLKRLIARNAANDPITERHRQLMAELREDRGRALRAFGTTNEAILEKLTLRLLRSDPDGRLGLLTTDEEAADRLEEAGLVPDGQGAWVRRR
ncbi:MAG TPA: hypothetical protein VHX16_17155 [Chloroflexota bacterium]|nr:hypothetical protein [Chloroflexota bacterium]